MDERRAHHWHRCGIAPALALALVGVSPSVLADVYHLPLLPLAADPFRQGVVRIVNHTASSGEVSITAIDDVGYAFGPVTLNVAGQHEAGASNSPQSVLRIFNAFAESGAVSIYAIDDAGMRTGPSICTLNASSAAEFAAADLASGSVSLGLSGGIGTVVGGRCAAPASIGITGTGPGSKHQKRAYPPSC